jgi:hypothetical protein
VSDEAAIGERFRALAGELNERQREGVRLSVERSVAVLTV